MSERGGANAGPPMTLGEGRRRWFLRPPRPHGEVIEDRTVSFLELFYDLVYVVLVGQIAHTLAEDVSWSGVLDFAVVFGLIWIGWFNGAQFHELHGREDGRNRTFIFLQMGILTVLAVFTGNAASTDGEQFALIYAALLAVLVWQWSTVYRTETGPYRRGALTYTFWLVVSIGALIASSGMEDNGRVAVWAAIVVGSIALVVVYLLRASDDLLGIRATDSMAERFGLFIIIVLGEVVVGVVGMGCAGVRGPRLPHGRDGRSRALIPGDRTTNARTYRLVLFGDEAPQLERISQIGTDHGLLRAPAPVPPDGLVLASAQRLASW